MCPIPHAKGIAKRRAKRQRLLRRGLVMLALAVGLGVNSGIAPGHLSIFSQARAQTLAHIAPLGRTAHKQLVHLSSQAVESRSELLLRLVSLAKGTGRRGLTGLFDLDNRVAGLIAALAGLTATHIAAGGTPDDAFFEAALQDLGFPPAAPTGFGVTPGSRPAPGAPTAPGGDGAAPGFGGGGPSGRSPVFVTVAESPTSDPAIAPPSPVPLPSAGFLLLGGLGAVAILRRRKTA